MIKQELSIELKSDKELCEPCIYGKAHRLPFGTREPAKEPGELIFADVCGPFDESFQKKEYLVIFKHDYTEFRYGYIIKQKAEVRRLPDTSLNNFLLTTVKNSTTRMSGRFYFLIKLHKGSQHRTRLDKMAVVREKIAQ